MENKKLTLDLFPALMAVCRMHAKAPFPKWPEESEILVMVRSPEEVSVVCAEVLVPKHIIAERAFRIFKIHGPLEFELVGIIASITKIMAEANISVFVFSTYDTDYFMVKDKDLDRALAVLYKAGHTVVVLKDKVKPPNNEK